MVSFLHAHFVACEGESPPLDSLQDRRLQMEWGPEPVLFQQTSHDVGHGESCLRGFCSSVVVPAQAADFGLRLVF